MVKMTCSGNVSVHDALHAISEVFSPEIQDSSGIKTLTLNKDVNSLLAAFIFKKNLPQSCRPSVGLGVFLWLAAPQVRLVEEVGEEQQVAEVHERSPGDVFEAWRTVAVLHPAVNQRAHRHPHDHLSDLSAGDNHGKWAGHAKTGGTCSVVAVHDCVHGVVHGHEPAAAGHHVFVGVPGVQQHGDVMVPVQEDQTLFPQHDEHRVTCQTQPRFIIHINFISMSRFIKMIILDNEKHPD